MSDPITETSLLDFYKQDYLPLLENRKNYHSHVDKESSKKQEDFENRTNLSKK
jgi:hypothetical protein